MKLIYKMIKKVVLLYIIKYFNLDNIYIYDNRKI